MGGREDGRAQGWARGACFEDVENASKSMQNPSSICVFGVLVSSSSGDQKQELEIADTRGELPQKLKKNLLKKGGSENTLESDFVKHSSTFGGAGVDFGRHFGSVFLAENARERKLEARY